VNHITVDYWMLGALLVGGSFLVGSIGLLLLAFTFSGLRRRFQRDR